MFHTYILLFSPLVIYLILVLVTFSGFIQFISISQSNFISINKAYSCGCCSVVLDILLSELCMVLILISSILFIASLLVSIFLLSDIYLFIFSVYSFPADSCAPFFFFFVLLHYGMLLMDSFLNLVLPS